MYRIDLPTDDNTLVQRVLTKVAKCSDDKVKIDLTVHNPARIWRLPGTMSCKGDSIPSRPHRMAKIVEHVRFDLFLKIEIEMQKFFLTFA